MRSRTTRIRRPGGGFWPGALAEVSIVAASIVYIVTSTIWALLLWEVLAMVYLGIGFALNWNGDRSSVSSRGEARAAAKWVWVLPLLSSFAGINSAVLALISRNAKDINDLVIGTMASVGVVLSWSLLHTGFAQMYEALDSTTTRDAIVFPGNDRPVFINYLYFSFTIGTSLATSDVTVNTIPARRLVLVHSTISFFYNALVVAVAFQVLQQVIAA